MINWELEERKFVDDKISEYRKSMSILSLIFMSDKQLNKNIENIKNKAILQYRKEKLDNFIEIIKEERKRIDETVEYINQQFLEYLKSQKALIKEDVKPFKIEATPCDNFVELKQIELVKVYSKPFEIAFLQENLDNKGE